LDLISRGLLTGALIISASSGCVLFEQPVDDQEINDAAQTDPAAYAQEVDIKLRRYSACRDNVASMMNESWERYTDQVGTDGKPKRRREGVFLRGISANSFRNCRRLIAAPEGGATMPVIEKTAVELIDAASRYAELTREIDGYLDAGTWKSDGWATLATLDPELRAAHERWLNADVALQQALDLRHIENDVLLLGVLARQAGRLEFASRQVMIHARPLVRCLERDPAPSIDECRPLFDAFDKVQGEFEDVHARDPEANKVFWMSTFANDVEEFHELAGDLVRKLGQKKLRAADVQRLRDAYSSLVRDAETLDFDFP
jgi:hypothetical protein